MKLLNAEKMRELEKRADASGNAFAMMMERAGTLTAQALIERWPVQGRRVLVLAGPGNNGGDGLVCARVLHEAGARVHLYLWKREPSDEDVNWRLCRERGIEFTRAEQDPGLPVLRQEVAGADFIVDAFLGTGVARPILGLLKDILDEAGEELTRPGTRLRGSRRGERETRRGGEREEGTAELVTPALRVSAFPRPPVLPSPSPPVILAVDLPSGLNPDTGELDPAALAADLTVTFAFPKVGQYAFPGAEAVGELVVADIGIKREWAGDVPLDVATHEEIRMRLPARPRDSNKGTFGKAILACGSLEFTGAPRLAAAAAGRAGAGLVTLATPRTIYPIVSANLNEATYLPLPDVDGAWSPRAVKPLAEYSREYEALLVGCGFGRAESTKQFVARLFGIGGTARQKGQPAGADVRRPALVIDADALNALAEVKEWWKEARFGVPPVLTPHPGEMARLVGSTVRAVQEDRVGIATRSAKEWNAIVVLKGAFTVIAAPDGNATLIPFATPALATAGTGDVLAGTIVGLLAQYRAASLKSGRDGAETAMQDAFNAALAGAYIHALAGEIAGEEIGPAGVVAGDLVPRLPAAMRKVRGGGPGD
jgi:ADP-dependent NAD(P)H-hydrate dehydratase / NAD(P)H-hydrate epimerase